MAHIGIFNLGGKIGYFVTSLQSVVAFLEGLQARHLTGIDQSQFDALMALSPPPSVHNSFSF